MDGLLTGIYLVHEPDKPLKVHIICLVLRDSLFVPFF